jgi:hypothetical protein
MLKSPKKIGGHEVGAIFMKCNIYIWENYLYGFLNVSIKSKYNKFQTNIYNFFP